MTGKLVIAGTRVPIARIIFLLKEGYTLDTIQDEYPHVSEKNLHGAVEEIIKLLDTSEYASKIL